MRGNRISKFTGCIAVLLVMVAIFRLSAQPSSQSLKLSSQFVSAFQLSIRMIPFMPHFIKRKLLVGAGFYVRKLAHMIIYTLLGAVTWTALRHMKIKRRAVRRALIIGMAYACLDEFHQYFVTGRSARVGDVSIDTLGICIGILLARVISYRIKYNKKYRKP